MVFILVDRIALLINLKTTSSYGGLVVQRSKQGRFGGPYLILEDSNRTLKKGDFPVLD